MKTIEEMTLVEFIVHLKEVLPKMITFITDVAAGQFIDESDLIKQAAALLKKVRGECTT